MESISKTRLYAIFSGMKQRCYNPNNPNYQFYGEKGITICDIWMGEHGIYNFMEWALSNGYEEHLTIDRIDADGPYSPDNCRWITQWENAKKQSLGKIGEPSPILVVVYPAIFHPNKDGSYTIQYPDLPGCISEGKTLGHAIDMAQSALNQWTEYLRDTKQDLPEASAIQDINLEAGEFVNLVRAEIKDTRAVRRTVSIPRWMDEQVSSAGLSLSRVLQDALTDRFSAN